MQPPFINVVKLMLYQLSSIQYLFTMEVNFNFNSTNASVFVIDLLIELRHELFSINQYFVSLYEHNLVNE